MSTLLLSSHFKERKFSIVKLLTYPLLLLGTLADAIHIYRIIENDFAFGSVSRAISFIFITSGLIGLLIIRFYLIKKSVTLSFFIISIILTLAIIISGLTYSIQFPHIYPLMMIVILSASIIYNVRTAFLYLILFFIILATIVFVHTQEILVPNKTIIESSYSSLIIFMTIIFLITYIAKLGYSEIENSYSLAFKHAKDLEKLNKNLNKKVKQRTKMLEQSFKIQADSVYTSAIIGSITKPLLHDIATPISSLQGALELMKISNSKELEEIAKTSVEKIIRIVNNGRDLMQSKDFMQNFLPTDLIASSLIILRSELEKNEIDIENQIEDSQVQILGIPALFERIVVNIFMNSIQELANNNKLPKKIVVTEVITNKYWILKIKDNGTGIPKNLLKDIFVPGFSLKADSNNFGFGLPFVKSMMEEKFGGLIEIESEEGKFTEVKLSFKLADGEKH